MSQSEPFLTEGITLGVPNDSATEITQIDNAIFVDSDGNLNFRDAKTPTLLDVDGNPLVTIKLKDLLNRVKGVYSKNGKLYFKDDTVDRSYSLQEIVQSYSNWKNRLTTGGIYWIGSTRITNNDCNNIKINVLGDPNIAINAPVTSGTARGYIKGLETNDYPTFSSGTKVFSIDKYLDGLSDYNKITNPLGFAFTQTGDLRWHDVPNLSITLPPLDSTKIVMLIAKLNLRLIESKTPLLFRLYDKTTGTELDRKAIINDAKLPFEQQPILTFTGKLPDFNNLVNKIDCACGPENENVGLQNNPTRIISVQFTTQEIIAEPTVYSSCDGISGNKFIAWERRIIGLPNEITDTPIVNMNIDAIIYDVSTSDNQGRKAGSANFINQDTVEVKFNKDFSGSDYSITLSGNKNIHTWYINKRPSGFVIKTEMKMTGTVDWIATKLKEEGDA